MLQDINLAFILNKIDHISMLNILTIVFINYFDCVYLRI